MPVNQRACARNVEVDGDVIVDVGVGVDNLNVNDAVYVDLNVD
jgi:hypothetical protein